MGNAPGAVNAEGPKSAFANTDDAIPSSLMTRIRRPYEPREPAWLASSAGAWGGDVDEFAVHCDGAKSGLLPVVRTPESRDDADWDDADVLLVLLGKTKRRLLGGLCRPVGLAVYSSLETSALELG